MPHTAKKPEKTVKADAGDTILVKLPPAATVLDELQIGADTLDVAADQNLALSTLETLTFALEAARAKGKTGWWNQKLCTTDKLRQSLVDAVNRQDHVAALAYSAMLVYRQS